MNKIALHTVIVSKYFSMQTEQYAVNGGTELL